MTIFFILLISIGIYVVDKFIAAKEIEGCSERTIKYYKVTVEHMLNRIPTEVRKITTDDIRGYLAEYQQTNSCSR